MKIYEAKVVQIDGDYYVAYQLKDGSVYVADFGKNIFTEPVKSFPEAIEKINAYDLVQSHNARIMIDLFKESAESGKPFPFIRRQTEISSRFKAMGQTPEHLTQNKDQSIQPEK